MKKDEKIVINPSKLKVRDEEFIGKKLKYRMTIVESKKQYKRQKGVKINEKE